MAGITAVTRAWLALLVISAISFCFAEILENRALAVALIMSITAVKVGIILIRFMDLRTVSRGLQVYFALWTAACAILIFSCSLLP
ncbi:cytochrome C oxidase subunit IV family protein [Sphingomonas sp. ID0503]|uniref:cytochrome C oxidase subunit IV family protein n=1 Tax=Sphingomonas sp. ID0503 TaxID=3399691 RepID=UPI003AFA4492